MQCDAARMQPVLLVCGLRSLFFIVWMCCAASAHATARLRSLRRQVRSPPCCQLVARSSEPHRKGKGRASRSLT